MATYATDDDLSLFIKNTSSLPSPFKPYHEAAYSEIRRSLLRAGITEETLDDLSDDTLAALVAPACHYSLYQFFQGFPSDPTLLDRAAFHLKEYSRTLALVEIESSAGIEEVPSYGKVSLG